MIGLASAWSAGASNSSATEKDAGAVLCQAAALARGARCLPLCMFSSLCAEASRVSFMCECQEAHTVSCNYETSSGVHEYDLGWAPASAAIGICITHTSTNVLSQGGGT